MITAGVLLVVTGLSALVSAGAVWWLDRHGDFGPHSHVPVHLERSTEPAPFRFNLDEPAHDGAPVMTPGVWR